ncbi:MAG: A24 family peptidase [Solidesulfovibrio sp.]|uniref:A24 family peptidase n=1 Tax=Solidesulfovibrio sp. TaxID=2910990 RepID=UPI002B1F71DD|nr:A24 family peptidase [Solidesulfovibrio sp.]MEA4855184.1 A24 family peptidase [Solidesulfovibrio sp.]
MAADPETILSFALTALACLAAAVADLRTRRIPNRITFPAMALLLAVHGAFSGLAGLGDSALGLAGGFLIFLIPHMLKVLGAGDVKLMAVVGAGLGAGAVVTAVLFTSVAGGLQFLLWLAWLRLAGRAGPKGWRPCYGPAIAAGALAAMALRLAGQPYLTFRLPWQ